MIQDKEEEVEAKEAVEQEEQQQKQVQEQEEEEQQQQQQRPEQEQEQEEQEVLPDFSGDVACLNEDALRVLLKKQTPDESIPRAMMKIGVLESAMDYLGYCDATKSTTVEELCGKLDVEPSNVHAFAFKSLVGRPAFFLVLDERKKRIVLAIRGTQDSRDVVTDMLAVAAPFTCNGVPGSVHQGFKAASDIIFANVFGHIQTLKEQHPDYPVRVIGHSLGGAVATLIALKLKDTFPCVRAVVFGSPRCISESLVAESKQCVTCFVNANDSVPRVKPNEIFKGLSATTESSKSTAGRMFSLFTRVLEKETNFVLPGNLLHLLPVLPCLDDEGTSEEQNPETVAQSSKDWNKFKREWSKNNGNPAVCTEVVLTSVSVISSLSLSSNGLTDHYINNYMASLQSLVKCLRAFSEANAA